MNWVGSSSLVANKVISLWQALNYASFPLICRFGIEGYSDQKSKTDINFVILLPKAGFKHKRLPFVNLQGYFLEAELQCCWCGIQDVGGRIIMSGCFLMLMTILI